MSIDFSTLFRAALVFGLAPGIADAAAPVRQFHASLESSSWRTESGTGVCAMVHEIPRFGRARFERRSGRRLQFLLDADQAPVEERAARLVSLPPAWKYGATGRELGEVALHKGKTPLRVSQGQALRIYYELEQGMAPTLMFKDWADRQDTVEVRLSPVRFREALPAFLSCTEKLLFLDFEPLSEQTVYFASDSDKLDRTARSLLKRLAREYRQQGDLRLIVGGHADERGGDDYNMALSQRRATQVANYLASRGVPARMIESRSFGESQPADPGRSREAWARNRRVIIWTVAR